MAIRKTLAWMVGLAAVCLVLVLMPGAAKAEFEEVNYTAAYLTDASITPTVTADRAFYYTVSDDTVVAPAEGTAIGDLVATGPMVGRTVVIPSIGDAVKYVQLYLVETSGNTVVGYEEILFGSTITGGTVYTGEIDVTNSDGSTGKFYYVYTPNLYVNDTLLADIKSGILTAQYISLLNPTVDTVLGQTDFLAEYSSAGSVTVDAVEAAKEANWANVNTIITNILGLNAQNVNNNDLATEPFAHNVYYRDAVNVSPTGAVDWAMPRPQYPGKVDYAHNHTTADAVAYVIPAGASLRVGDDDMITSGNVVNASVDGSGGGTGSTAVYNRFTNTLTLTNYNGGPITTGGMNLNIVLVGDNTVTYDGVGSVIFIDGPLKISGAGTLNIVHEGNDGSVVGITANGDVNIDSGTVNLDIGLSTGSTCTGIDATGDTISINAANGANLTINLEGGTEAWALRCADLNVIGSAIQKEGKTEAEAEVVNEVTYGNFGNHGAGKSFFLSIISTGGGGGSDQPGQQGATEKPKKETPTPIVAVLYDVQKTGDAFSFKTIIANARGSLPGATVTVKLNDSYSATVTIGEDGIGFGTIEAPGYAWNIANFYTRPNVQGAAGVASAYDIYSTGECVRR